MEVPDLRGRGLRHKRRADNLRRFALDLHAALGHEEVSLTEIGRLMPPEFRTAKPSTLHIGDFIKLYPNLFRTTGEAQAMKVKAVQRRLRGKTKV